jgi:DNA-binding beta-propeller fold protein YncE
VQSSATIGSDPLAVTVSDDGRTAFMADSAPGDVYAVTLPNLKVAWKSHVGGAPFGMAVHGGRLYVTLFDSAAVVELDPLTGLLLATDPTSPHPGAITFDAYGHFAVASGNAFGIALAGGQLWTADYKRSVLIASAGGREVPLPLPVHPFWLSPGSTGNVLIAAEGANEDTDPGGVFSYDTMSGRFTTLARPHDPDLVLESESTVLVSAHGDHEVLAIRSGKASAWAKGSAAVGLAADPALGLVVVVVNSHE